MPVPRAFPALLARDDLYFWPQGSFRGTVAEEFAATVLCIRSFTHLARRHAPATLTLEKWKPQ
eukprot:8228821-Pyramimonas_sp.AAC.1